MAKSPNFERISKIEELYHQGYSDGKISGITGWPLSNIHYYRNYYLSLPAHQTKRMYDNLNSKLVGYIIRGVKSSAKRRNLDFNLTHDDIEIVTHCPLLGTELSYKNFLGSTDSNSLDFATVDRIDSTKGYVKGNVWIISRLANNMKSCATANQLKVFATNVLSRI